MSNYKNLSDNDRIKNIFESLQSIPGFENFFNHMEIKETSSNTEQRNRITGVVSISEKCLKISLMIAEAQLYKDAAIDAQLKTPEHFQWYSEVEQYWQKVIDRLKNYLNNTASEIHI